MRKARAWFRADFHPASAAEVLTIYRGKNSAPYRMVTTYWNMAAALVLHGAIDEQMFADTNGEHVMVYARLEPHLAELRAALKNPGYLDQLEKLILRMPDAHALHRYAPGKWSIKEVIGHVTDTERVFSYRALRFARADATALPGFDENAWVPPGKFDARSLKDLAAELDAVRRATIALFRGLDAAALARRGTANDNAVSVGAIAWLIAGHDRHQVARPHGLYRL